MTHTYTRAGELADLAGLVEAIQREERGIRARQETVPGYAGDRLREIMETMNTVVKSELRKLQREMEFPR